MEHLIILLDQCKTALTKGGNPDLVMAELIFCLGNFTTKENVLLISEYYYHMDRALGIQKTEDVIKGLLVVEQI